MARLQLAGDGLRPVHGHEAGLLHRLALPPEVQTEAGDRGGLAWEEVRTLIERHLANLPDLTVYLCADTEPAQGEEAAMLHAFARDHRMGELPPFLKGKVRSALLAAAVPSRFRQLAAITGVGKQSYARLFQHYYRLGDGAQLSLIGAGIRA
ncbi:hypothetical protein NZK33_16785 [Cyanobium sp. FGCU-6]|nr:hypothetical protein [Cyanobium sp. FGCU6]